MTRPNHPATRRCVPQSEVLVALGNVVMAVDPDEGLTCLQIAIKLREDEVRVVGADV